MRILQDSSRPKDNLNGAKRRALTALRKNTDLTILLADKGKATVVLNTVDYNQDWSPPSDPSLKEAG